MEKDFIVRDLESGMVEMVPRHFDAVAWMCSTKEPRCKKEEIDKKYTEFLEWNKNTTQDTKLNIFNKWLEEYTTTIYS